MRPLSSQIANVCVNFIKSQGKSKLAMLYDTKNAYAVSGHDATKKALEACQSHGLRCAVEPMAADGGSETVFRNGMRYATSGDTESTTPAKNLNACLRR